MWYYIFIMKTKSQVPHIVKNSQDEETHTESIHFNIEENGIKLSSDDTLLFSRPVVITDNTEMWSGAKYDIETMDIDQYKGKLTADHRDTIQFVLGSVIGLKKSKNRVTIDGLKLAVKENPLADYAKRMIMGGHLTDFSVETIGPWPGEDRIYRNAKLVGLSLVVTGNNKQAHINQIAMETMEAARQNGLDVAMFAQALKLPIDKEEVGTDNNPMKMKNVKNIRGFAVAVKYQNSAKEELEVTLQPGQAIEVVAEHNVDIEKQITDAVEQKTPVEEVKTAAQTVDVTEAVKNAVAPLLAQIEEIKQGKFDNKIEEPTFMKANTTQITTELSGLDYRTLHNMQIRHAWDMLKAGNTSAGRKLNEINKFNLEKLQEAGKVPSVNPVTMNAITIADFGNFVISPELLKDIEGFRSDFKPLLSKLNFRDTLSLDMAWLTRSGDINMTEVAFCDDNANGNLKPISEYEAAIETSRLQELASVTPVCNAATRFLAVDLLEDVAEGYRNDYDRKRAQIFVARLQQAVNETGQVVHYNTSSSGQGANVNALQSYMDVGAAMQENVMNGYFVLSLKSYWELRKRQAGAGINTSEGFSIFTKNDDGQSLMFGAPYIITPNELLPKLGSSETRTFAVGGVNVVITDAIFYVDLNTFKGRTSGGLNYDLSTEAAYEQNGTVKSAYQRNELVLRGSFFRGGAILDPNKVVGLEALNLS